MGATLEQFDLSLERDYKLPGRCHEALVLNPGFVPSLEARTRLLELASDHERLATDLGREADAAKGLRHTIDALLGRAQVLLDAVPMTDPFFGYVPLSAIAPERLESIRVTRGGGTGPFGAGAPARTATPMPVLASRTRLSGLTIPSLSSRSIAGSETITASKISPSLIFCATTAGAPTVNTTL